MSEQWRPSPLREHLGVVRRRGWIAGVVAVGAMSLALVFSILQSPRYAGTAQILVPVTPRYTTALVDPNGAVRNQDAKRLLQNQVQYIESSVITGEAAKELGFTPNITARALAEADILEVRAETSDPQKAADIANTVANTYVNQRNLDSINGLNKLSEVVQKSIDADTARIEEIDGDLDAMSPAERAGQQGQDLTRQRVVYESQRAKNEEKKRSIADSTQLVTADAPQVINPAVPTDSPFQPTTRRNVIIGALIGLVLGAALMYVLDQLDDTVKTSAELEAVTNLTTLASVPRSPSWRKGEEAVLHYLSDPTSPTAEGYRSLRTAIQFANLTTPIKTLLITSALPNEGKSSTAANLAVAFAASGLKVVVVSCDLRRPRLHDFFNLDGEVGFTSLLRRIVSLDEMMADKPKPREVLVIPSGQAPRNPSELLSTPQAQELLATIAERADLLIIDAPPVLPVTDSLILSAYADAVIMVARAGETRLETVDRATEQLNQAAAPLIGTVLIGAEDDPGVGYSYRRYAHRTHRDGSRGNKPSRPAPSAPPSPPASAAPPPPPATTEAAGIVNAVRLLWPTWRTLPGASGR